MANSGYKWLVLAVVGTGTFMSALDGSVVNIVLPMIQTRYGATIASVTWVSTAYLLAISSLLLTFGRLGDMLGYKYVYSTGFVIFGAGSLFSGIAPTLGLLVTARVVQGVGAAVLSAIGPALLTTTFLPSERGRALGLLATATYTGLTVGPSVGGFIAGQFTWHWVFLVNVPISLMGIGLALTLLRKGEAGGRQRFDLAGAGLLACGLTAVLMGLSEADNWGWKSPAIIGLLAGGVVLLGLFILQEQRAKQPMMPLWLFRNVAFAAGALAAFVQYMAIFMLMFLIPFYLQSLRGFSPDIVGAVMTAQPLAMVAVTGLSGWISDRVGPRGPASVGLLILALALWLIAGAGAQAGVPVLIVWLGLAGLGSGLFTSPNNSAIMGAAPRERQGIASGLLAVSRNVGMVTGIAVGGSIFGLLQSAVLHRGLDARAAFLGGFRPTLLVASGLALTGAVVSLLRPGKTGQEFAVKQ